MKNRHDKASLAILGLSISVVLALCQDQSRLINQNLPFSSIIHSFNQLEANSAKQKISFPTVLLKHVKFVIATDLNNLDPFQIAYQRISLHQGFLASNLPNYKTGKSNMLYYSGLGSSHGGFPISSPVRAGPLSC